MKSKIFSGDTAAEVVSALDAFLLTITEAKIVDVRFAISPRAGNRYSVLIIYNP